MQIWSLCGMSPSALLGYIPSPHTVTTTQALLSSFGICPSISLPTRSLVAAGTEQIKERSWVRSSLPNPTRGCRSPPFSNCWCWGPTGLWQSRCHMLTQQDPTPLSHERIRPGQCMGQVSSEAASARGTARNFAQARDPAGLGSQGSPAISLPPCPSQLGIDTPCTACAWRRGCFSSAPPCSKKVSSKQARAAGEGSATKSFRGGRPYSDRLPGPHLLQLPTKPGSGFMQITLLARSLRVAA